MSMRGRKAAQGELFTGFGSTTMCLLIICCVFGEQPKPDLRSRTKAGSAGGLSCNAPSRGEYRRRSRIDIMFGRLKDWRRVATRYDRCPTVSFSAVTRAATVIFWL
jgi:transposase